MQRIFMKKVKNYNDDDYISDEDEDDESEESFYDSDDEIEVCPENYPTTVYNSILELRDKRILLEDELKLSQRQCDNVERNHRKFCSKLKVAENNLIDLKRKVQTFEDEKLKAINEITVAVPLTTSQIYFSDQRNDDNTGGTGIDAGLHNHVVFSNDNLLKLINRSREIAKEIEHEQSVFKDLQIDLKQIMKTNKGLEESIAAQRKRCEELQILKFGQKVDIDMLDKLSETSPMTKNRPFHLELESAAKKQEKKLNEINTQNRELKQKLKIVTEESTQILNEIATLSKRQIMLEKEKETNTENEGKSLDDEQASNDEEISNLRKIIHNQLEEKKRLFEDIKKLSRKDGKNMIHQFMNF